MRVKVELTGEEILALLECYRVLGKDLGSVHPDYRVDAHKAAYALGDGYRESVRLTDEAVAMDRKHEAHGGDESPDREGCEVCIDDLDFFLRYGESRPR